MTQAPFDFYKSGTAVEQPLAVQDTNVQDINVQDNVIRLNLSQCFNPGCLASNPGHLEVCQRCQSSLLLGGRYRAIQTIGAGGFAATFKAVDEHRLGTPCVIKQFLPKQKDSENYQKAVDLFTQEAVLLKDLGNHPQIPELKAFLEQDNQLYIVQEFIEGFNLLQEFGQRGCFQESDINQILKSLLPVLQFIHDHHVIHRDIKPSNIIRQNHGNLALIDFGSSHQSYIHLFDRRTPKTATPGYAPPEQMRGKVFANSDLFSLGLTCLRLLTGCFPDEQGVDPLFDEQTQQWQWERHTSSINGKLGYVLERLLQTDLLQRYSSAQAVLEDLADPTEICWVTTSRRATRRAITQEDPDPDYIHLQSLLAQKDYQAADNETWRILLALAGRTAQNNLTLSCVETLSCEALHHIDRLWSTQSQGQFGLRVQQQLYQELGGTAVFDFLRWEKFAQRVGWCRDRHWLNYTELDFSSDAPKGHLPTCCMDSLNRQGSERGVYGWWRLGFVTLLERLECYPK
jgi:serine/threonine protein kinase